MAGHREHDLESASRMAVLAGPAAQRRWSDAMKGRNAQIHLARDQGRGDEPMPCPVRRAVRGAVPGPRLAAGPGGRNARAAGGGMAAARWITTLITWVNPAWICDALPMLNMAGDVTCEVTPKARPARPRNANRGSLPKHPLQGNGLPANRERGPRVADVIEPDTQICGCGGGLHPFAALPPSADL